MGEMVGSEAGCDYLSQSFKGFQMTHASVIVNQSLWLMIPFCRADCTVRAASHWIKGKAKFTV